MNIVQLQCTDPCAGSVSLACNRQALSTFIWGSPKAYDRRLNNTRGGGL